MKKIRILILCVLCSICTFAQNTATNFVTDDCSGVTHNLFDSLDAGNIIVIAWVMPCGPCATYAYEAYSAVQYLAPSYPGKIDFYLVDDFANTSCVNLVGWGNTNNMPLNTTFSSSDISMTDYGSIGMPKVVVLSGNNHTVYYNENNNQINHDDVLDALLTALGAPSSVSDINDRLISLNCFPNPANGILNIRYEVKNSSKTKFEIVNILGETLLCANDDPLSSVLGIKTVDINTLENGVYFLNAYSGTNVKTIRFIVVEN